MTKELTSIHCEHCGAVDIVLIGIVHLLLSEEALYCEPCFEHLYGPIGPKDCERS